MPGELISREALERIIQRAAELQTGERDIGEGLTEEEVLALGRDVGIPATHLRQALLEERIRPHAPAPRGVAAWLVGPRELVAARVVPGSRDAVHDTLARWMEHDELLQIRRRYPDVTTWEPKAGAFASIQRALGVRGRRYALAEAAEIRSHAVQLEPGFCHVLLSADVRNRRAARLTGAASLAGLAAAGTAALAGLSVAIPFVLLPALVLGGAAVAAARQHRRDNERVQLGLEQVLDRLERGEIRAEHALPPSPASAFVRVAEEIRKTLQG
jgi:hypothetical protein